MDITEFILPSRSSLPPFIIFQQRTYYVSTDKMYKKHDIDIREKI